MDMRIDQAYSEQSRPFTGLEKMLRARLLKQMAQLTDCRLTLRDPLGEETLGQPAAVPEHTLHASIRVRDPAFYRHLASHGSVGAGEAWIDGLWQCDDLVALVRILVRNRDILDAMETGMARLGGLAMRAWHALRRNTRGGSKRNIAAHYDLGNPLFELFLDPSLMYSSAIYADPRESLDVAATRKLERICRKLDLKADDHVVEIGTGWGGFAIHAASRYGCRVTTTTISQEQYDLARQRIAHAGLQDRVTVLLEDYRDLEGRYDKLVSIEMIEAIGHQYLGTYFRTVANLLKHDGAALIQAITIEDHRYRQALNAVDFIKRYIFPGSFIPCVSAMLQSAAQSSDLRLFNLEDIGPSYALTLRAWRERFLERLPDVRELGYDEQFVRMWEFYLAYCEGGFLERSIGDVQMLFTRPGNRRASWLPDLESA
ncbi:cyclopropane-fatty-acyl-phospholipid synthase family protein [Oleiagrimonas citrea]|uniref:Class I SAM-dependent methyltransferase n=2 Tax=Oleiagrimonas citrea TaxID=1665687 RepID=A0A846ZMH4_9GAMM|nr:class I SAM-dependent methyltransferase [Oleiagrimonas citrea]